MFFGAIGEPGMVSFRFGLICDERTLPLSVSGRLPGGSVKFVGNVFEPRILSTVFDRTNGEFT